MWCGKQATPDELRRSTGADIVYFDDEWDKAGAYKLHSSTCQLNLSALDGTGGARRGRGVRVCVV